MVKGDVEGGMYGGGMSPTGYYEIRSVNAWVVHILLECILVEESILYGATPCKQIH